MDSTPGSLLQQLNIDREASEVVPEIAFSHSLHLSSQASGLGATLRFLHQVGKVFQSTGHSGVVGWQCSLQNHEAPANVRLGARIVPQRGVKCAKVVGDRADIRIIWS